MYKIKLEHKSCNWNDLLGCFDTFTLASIENSEVACSEIELNSQNNHENILNEQFNFKCTQDKA